MSGEKLELNPGSPRRRSISGWKCLVIFVGVLIAGSLATFVAAFFQALFTHDPHRALRQNVTLAEVANRSTVVRPLIDHEQEFDIAASVWLRKLGSSVHEIPLVVDGSEVSTPKDEQVEEELLFSDVVFRGLHLRDRHKFSQVNFAIPTALFQSANLSNFDLRGSFVILPSSPSLLDHLKNFTTSTPEFITPFPVRAWPFPLGSSASGEKSLVDKAIESFGTTIPLIQFHPTASRCPNVNEDHDDDEEGDDEANVSVPKKPSLNRLEFMTPLVTTAGLSVTEKHPYVVTKTHLRLIDEVRLFNRKAFVKAQRQLRKTSCGQNQKGIRPNVYMCDKTYDTHGHWETQFELEMTDEASGNHVKEFAYSPSFLAAGGAIGPKDLVAIPLNRENCTAPSGRVVDTASGFQGMSFHCVDPVFANATYLELDILNVTWRLAYSGLSPAQNKFTSIMKIPLSLNFSQTERQLLIKQDSAVLANGLVGFKSDDDSHPRRRAALIVAATILPWIETILELRYWFTRTSTVSISVPGTAFIAMFDVCVTLSKVVAKLVSSSTGHLDELWKALLAFLMILLHMPISLLMLRAILRIELCWRNGGWVPILQRWEPTHKERTSARLDARTSWGMRTAILAIIAAFFHILKPREARFLPSAHAALDEKQPVAESVIERIIPDVALPFFVGGKILQFILNARSGTYAGSYKITAVLKLASQFTVLGMLVPAVVGPYDARNGITWFDLFMAALFTFEVWQALTLKDASSISENDHFE